MKKLYLLLITSLLTITLSFTEVKAYNGNEIIPFNPDPSLVTEWDVSVLGPEIDSVEFDTPIFKVIIPEEIDDAILFFDTLKSNILGKNILWIYPLGNDFKYVEIICIDIDIGISTIWLGGGQSIIPTMLLGYFRVSNSDIEDIYIYPDVIMDFTYYDLDNNIFIYSYNFEYELNEEYQLGYDDGYDDGWGEKNKMTDITFLTIGLIIFIIANILGFIYKNNLLTALSGLLWLLPIFLVDNIFIKIFSVIIMLITFLFSFKERGDYYV